jgi:hypothetical protein
VRTPEQGPFIDENGTRWWALDDVESEFGISAATVRAIYFKKRPHIALNGRLIECRLERRGLRSGGAKLMHFREDQLLRLKKHYDQPDYHDDHDGEKWLRTNGLATATKLTRSCIKEKAGELFRSKTIPRNGQRVRFHRLRDAKEAKQKLTWPDGYLPVHKIINSDRYPHIDESLLDKLLRTGHKAIPDGPKTKRAPVNGHERPVFDIGQLDRIEAYEKWRHENILDNDERIWSTIGNGLFMDPDGQLWCDYNHAFDQFGIGRKLLDPIYNEFREEMGRAVSTELLSVPIKRRNGQSAIHHVRVFWLDDVTLIREHQDYQDRLLKIGACRDRDGNLYATGTRLGLRPHVALRMRRKGLLKGFTIKLFGKSVWLYRRESKEHLRRIGTLDDVVVLQPDRTVAAPLPKRTIIPRSVIESDKNAGCELVADTTKTNPTVPKNFPDEWIEAHRLYTQEKRKLELIARQFRKNKGSVSRWISAVRFGACGLNQVFSVGCRTKSLLPTVSWGHRYLRRRRLPVWADIPHAPVQNRPIRVHLTTSGHPSTHVALAPTSCEASE